MSFREKLVKFWERVAMFWEKLTKFMQPKEKEEPKEESPKEESPTEEALTDHPDEAGEQAPALTQAAAPPVEQVEPASPGLELEISLQSDLGSVRTNNEDRGVYKRPTDPEVAASKGTLVIVADGMGGASAGEVASDMAVRLIPDLYYNSENGPALALKEALEMASREIHLTAQAQPELRGMGTTCVAVAFLTPEVHVAWVGDSRLYLLRDGSFYQLTEDQTVVNEMVRKGILTREQARNHEERNVLSMSMGGRPEINACHWENPMVARAGDRWLVCSDGLHDLVGEAEMQAIITESTTHRAVQNLIDAAKLKGGYDNITAALVYVFIPTVESETDLKATREVSISPA